MATYYVDVTVEYYKTYKVEADSEEEANEIANEKFCDEHDNNWDSLTATAELEKV